MEQLRKINTGMQQAFVPIPKKEWARIIRILDKLEGEVEQPVSEEEAANYMGINKKTLQNLYYANKIPTEAIKKNASGKRFYIKSKLVR